MFLTENSESRNQFLGIITKIENTNKNDRMLNSLVNKNKENFNRRMLSAKFDELNINKDKLLYNNPNLKKRKTLKYIRSFKNTLPENKTNKNINYKFQRYLTESISEKCYNIFENLKDGKSKNINIKREKQDNSNYDIILQSKEKGKGKEKKFNSDNYFLDEKKFKKLDDLKTFFNLIETHEKMQYHIDLDPSRPKLNFIRNNNNNKLFKSSVTYDKNCIFFNKKYKLILDQINRNIKKGKKKKKINNYTINSEENRFNSYSPHLSKHKNSRIKKKKLYKINSDPYNLFPKKNKNKNKENNNNNNNNNYKKNEICSFSDDKKYSKNNKNKNINNNNYIYNNNYVSNYVNSSRPQTAITTASNKTKFIKSSQNETTDFGETSSLSLLSDINNLKLFNISKKESNLSTKKCRRNLSQKLRNKSKKILYEILTEALEKSKKIKNNLKMKKKNKEKMEEEEEERKIKNLIKKKRTNIDLLIKELKLYYKEQKIDLEQLVINNVFNISKHLQNLKQFRLMNKIANKVIVEDKILSKEVFLESSLAKKLRTRIKSKSDKEFEFLIEKRKYLKNKIIRYKNESESEVIKKLMKNEIFDFDDIKSLNEVIFKYRTMNHY